MSLQTICDSIAKVIDAARPPLAKISPILIFCESCKRPGLSATLLASNIIRRQAEAGAPVGPAADGSQNIMEAMEVIRAEEYVKALKMDAMVSVSIPAGALAIECTGANAGGPVTVIGTNTNTCSASGIIDGGC